MKSSKSESGQKNRQRASKAILSDADTTPKTLSIAETNRLMHELQVHQIELEAQNQELLRAKQERETSRKHYFELFDLAPVGYMTLNKQGMILEANITVASLLGVVRSALVNTPLSRFILPEDRGICCIQRTQTEESDMPQLWEVRIKRPDGSFFWTELKATPTRNNEYWVVMLDITDRKLVENAFQESEARYQTIVEDQTDLICRYRPDGRISFVNTAYLTYFGKKRTQLIDHEFIPQIPEPDLTNLLKQLSKISFKRPIANVEHRVIMPDGTVRWQQWSHRGIYSAELDLIEYQAVGRDITIRKHSDDVQAFLARTSSGVRKEPFFNDLARYLAQSLDMYFICIDRLEGDGLTATTLAVWCDGHFEDNVSYALKDTPCGDVVGKEICCFPANVCQSFPRDGMLHELKAESYVGVTLWSHTGQPIGLIVVIGQKPLENRQQVEITLTLVAVRTAVELERLKAEAALRLSEDLHRFTLRTAMDGFYLTDIQGHILDVNESLCLQYGYSAQELSTMSISDLEAIETHEDIENHIQKIMTQGTDRFETRHRRKDGSVFDVEVSVQYHATDGGRMVTFVRDITGRKQYENEMRLSKTAAEAANQAKSAFLATISHEIRTPLNALMGSIELLASSQLMPRQQEYLTNCQISSQMLLQTINDVLDFTKIEAGRLLLTNESFSVSSMVRKLVRLYTVNAELKGIELTCSLADDLPVSINCDQHRLSQIITNLISNAIKYTNLGIVSLEITCKQSFSGAIPDMKVLVISVRDTGVGIPKDRQASIFDSFTQVENFSTRRTGGTGLGLAICKRLAEMMGGGISLVSSPGEGSVFTLSLPVTVCNAPLQQVRERRVKIHAVTSRSILLADDDALGRTVTAALLQRRGHRVTTVESGVALLEALQRDSFDIVISDISMPDMDGMEVARIIRSGHHAGIDPQIPIIAMTAHAFAHDQDRFRECGFYGYVAKPVDFENLLDQINELCPGVVPPVTTS
jgi:PAS domain S-box-containing protein